MAVLSIVVGFATPSVGAPRFHRLTERLLPRLSEGARRNAGAVAKIGHATGFLVQRDGGRGLLLTKEHVAGDGVKNGSPIRFQDGTEGQALRLVAKDAALDYALVEVGLPHQLAAEPVQLQPGTPRPGQPVYGIAAYGALRFRPLARALGGGPQAVKDAIATRPDPDGYTGHFLIGAGRLTAADPGPRWIELGSVRVKGTPAALPNAPGMSGSPIVASDTHGVIGLHSAGNANPSAWNETSIPVGLILRDLARKRDAGKLPGSSRRLVGELLNQRQ